MVLSSVASMAGQPVAMPDTHGLNYYEAAPHWRALLRHLPQADRERAEPLLREIGALAGTVLDELATTANRHVPELVSYDRRGQRIDEVVFHPAYRELGRIFYERFGLAAMSYRDGVCGWPGRVPQVAKLALVNVASQAEYGIFCPISMTDTLTRVLLRFASPEIQALYVPRLTATRYEDLYEAAMFLTERAGGSDVGQTQTVARHEADGWHLYGDKWFCSNASADLILTLARPEGAPPGTRGLGLYLVPRLLPDGRRNTYTINRLKDKLGTRSMASGEVTLNGAFAHEISGPGQGFLQMTEMVNLTRLWTANGAAALMRRAYLEAITHARGRVAFGKALAEHALMRETLLDLLLEVESCESLVFWTAETLQATDDGMAGAAALLRVLTPLAKYYVSKHAEDVAAEAMEVRGGNGYIEDWPNARILRDSYVNSIWEGSSNVIVLDVARALRRAEVATALADALGTRLDRVRDARGQRAAAITRGALERLFGRLRALLERGDAQQELPLRRLVERLAQLVCATLLLDEAQDQINAGEGYRHLFLVVRLLAQHIYIHPDGQGADPQWATVAYFNEVVDWQMVPPEACDEGLAAAERVAGLAALPGVC
jgi:acyl-CoA dehydrogenase